MAMTDCESRPGQEVSLEELDDMLGQVTVLSPFSADSLRGRVTSEHGLLSGRDALLSKVFQILQSSEAKWIVRILLKNYSPARVPETLIMIRFHTLLPNLLRFRSLILLLVAMAFLDKPAIRDIPIWPVIDTCDGILEAIRREIAL